MANGGDLDRWLVRNAIVPLLLFGLGVLLLILRGRLLGLRRLLHSLRRGSLAHLALKAHHLWLLLLHGAGSVKSVGCGLGGWGMGVEAVLRRRTSTRGRRETAGAALDAPGEAGRRGVGDLERQPFDTLARNLLVLSVHRGRGGVRVCVHGCYAGVVLLRDEVAMLRQARGALEHVDTGVLLVLLVLRLLRLVLLVWERTLVLGVSVVLVCAAGRQAMPVAILLLNVESVHVLAKVGKGLSTVEVMAMMAHHGHALRRPGHGVALWSRWGILASRL